MSMILQYLELLDAAQPWGNSAWFYFIMIRYQKRGLVIHYVKTPECFSWKKGENEYLNNGSVIGENRAGSLRRQC